MRLEFWQGKSVFLTGHTGFKGSWLSLWLAEMGAKVTGYALPAPTTPNLFEVAQIGKRITSIIGDVCDLGGLTTAMKSAAPDIVIHMAAYFAVNKHLGALASARAGNVIGGGDWAADRLVPDMIRALNADQSPIIRRPHAIRPWQHVLEPLSGYLTAIEYCVEGKSATPDSWNFAPNEAGQVDVETIARGICNAWGSSITPSIQPEQGAVHEAHLLALDATKAKRELQWHPRWDLFQTLERTVEWYRAYTDGRDMQQFTLAQCSDYYYTDSTKTKV